MGVFDSIVVQDASAKTLLTLQRGGPIETIEFQTDVFGRILTDGSGNPLISETNLLELVEIPVTFGINSSNQLYYDTNGPSPGEACHMYVVPGTDLLIFDTADAD